MAPNITIKYAEGMQRVSLFLLLGVVTLALAPGCECKAATPSSQRSTPAAPEPSSDRSGPELLNWAIERLAPHHDALPKPRSGDWLAEHEESGQTFDEYRAADPVKPGGKRNRLYIQPLGPLTPTQRKIVELAANYMERFFGLAVSIRPMLGLDEIPDRAKRTHPTWGTKQILTTYVLEDLLAPRLPDDAAAFISFTTSDLWPGKGWNFVFGQASLRDRVGVWSIHRNGAPDESDAVFKLVLVRTLKTAVHETSHMFSMHHCTAYACVMNGSNDRRESDSHPLWLCPQCMAKLNWAAHLDTTERYAALAEFAHEQGLDREEAFFRRSIDSLR
jgi:archaemetzincin